jgi:uncharacterized protein (TIGR02145 family)
MALCAALAAAAVACETEDDNDNDNGNGNTAVKIGGVTWAACNVDNFQTFAAKPDMYTKFYQWNRSKAWPATGSVSGWETTIVDPTWTVNPCPAGWRLPTQAEYQALHDAGSTWANANTRGNAVAGRFYGPNHATASLPNNMVGCVFFPATGCLYTDGTLNEQGSLGCGWSSTQGSSFFGCALGFSATVSNPFYGNDKSFGYPVRCVR